MATNFFQTKWSERQGLEKILILGGTGGILIFVALNRKKWIKAWKARKDKKTFTDDLNVLEIGGQKASYLDSQYVIFANSLFQAMDSSAFDWGTDEVSVAGVMYKMKNDVDINKLIVAFDKKDGYDLSEWITGDFDSEDKELYINQILRKKGIKYQF